ncbi:hypothetical protein CROQUDRAFT_80271 [Cronartium quercuum f. sp. fusiforme G11]|uniref:Uncharacterized protein n=1 Tax=Cronartium quercuum f. sp. fusiforme G11 TaxID=708437 RepID=A0A9P6NHA9_9BASI|nr:hypothetical protein CROQUDRAFT_80271 [Cronartium quercuum f. sp. fusiforme G11]
MSHHKKINKPTVPKSHLYITTSGQNINQQTKPWKTIERYPFTSQLDIIFPTKQVKPSRSSSEIIDNSSDNVIELLSNINSYQLSSNFDISLFLHPEVARNYLRSGSLVALSIPELPGDDVFGIDGFGKIHLRLNRSTYESLGIVGRPSKFGPSKQYYMVEIDMRLESMRNGKKQYDRIYNKLQKFPLNAFMSWLPPSTFMNHSFKKWKVMISWVNELGELDEFKLPKEFLDIINLKKCKTNIIKSEKPFKNLWSIEQKNEADLISLYDELGLSLMSNSNDNNNEISSKENQILLNSISIKGGLFNSFKILQTLNLIIKLLPNCAIFGHLNQCSPLSFLSKKQIMKKNHELEIHQEKKRKKKNGKGIIINPERGIEAGFTNWSLICFDNVKDKDSKNTNFDEKDEKIILKRSIDKLEETEEEEKVSKSKKWVFYEFVGHDDTHC